MELSPAMAIRSEPSCSACLTIWSMRSHRSVGDVELVLGWQAGQGHGAARGLLHNRVRGAKSEAVDAVPMQARGVDLIITRDLVSGLAGGESSVNLRAFDVFTSATLAHEGSSLLGRQLNRRACNVAPHQSGAQRPPSTSAIP